MALQEQIIARVVKDVCEDLTAFSPYNPCNKGMVLPSAMH